MTVCNLQKAIRRMVDELAALLYVEGYLGLPSASERDTERVRLQERIRAGEFYPFDGAAAKRLVEEMVNMVNEEINGNRDAGTTDPEKVAEDVYGRDYPLSDALNAVGPGWAELVRRCYRACAEHNVCISQVKEKFGGLRFYVTKVGRPSVPREVFDVIDSAEEQSLTTCEACGHSGRVREEQGWFKTLCDNCFSKGDRA